MKSTKERISKLAEEIVLISKLSEKYDLIEKKKVIKLTEKSISKSEYKMLMSMNWNKYSEDFKNGFDRGLREMESIWHLILIGLKEKIKKIK